jgi:hypothetical protein
VSEKWLQFGSVASDPDGAVVSRSIVGKFGKQTFGAHLTTKGVVYPISVSQWYTNDSVGQQVAEQLFRHYLQVYSAQTASPIARLGRSMWQNWTSTDGHPIEIALDDCPGPQHLVKVSDYQRQLSDDGVSDEERQRSSYLMIGRQIYCF